MKRVMVAVLAVALFDAQCASGEQKRRDACETIPKRALERAEKSLRMAHPIWGVIPVIGDDGEWRCKISGSYARRYDKTLLGERLDANITLLADKDGSIFYCDDSGCFSIDRWK